MLVEWVGGLNSQEPPLMSRLIGCLGLTDVFIRDFVCHGESKQFVTGNVRGNVNSCDPGNGGRHD